MDSDQQKEFMSFFPQDSNHNQGIDAHQQPLPMFPFTQGSSSHPAIQQSHLNTQINMDLLMQMQGIDNASVSPQSSYNPQALLEQQFKLTQLQQLQQLQNQIFQQQVIVTSSLILSALKFTCHRLHSLVARLRDCYKILH